MMNRQDAKNAKIFKEKRAKKGSLFLGVILGVLGVLAVEDSRAEVQETPSVSLPAKYLEDVRAPLKIGEAAPNFSLKRCAYDMRTPQAIELSKWRDAKKNNGSVIVFWAFWCDTWKDMTRDLNALKPQLDAMKLQVLGVAVDASQQPVSRRAFETKKIWWPVAIDEKSTVSANWGVRRVPTIFVLDKSGNIQKVYEGFPGKQTFVKQTAHALKIKMPISKPPVK